MNQYAKRIFSIGTENAFKMGSHITQLENEGVDVVKLNLGEPDFNTPDLIKAEIKRQLDLNNTHYCDPQGLLTLREAISEQMRQSRGLSISPKQVVIFPGAKPCIGFSQSVYCDPGDQIIYPSPGFPIFESFAQYLGLEPIPALLNEKNDFRLTAEHLEDLITPKTKMIVLNFPSNPTGSVLTQAQTESIADVILKKCHPNVRVYSDEIYERILFDGDRHFSIASVPGMEKRTIISSGFSKTFSWTGGRIGYGVFPSIEEAELFNNLNINYFSCLPPYNQAAAALALNHPESESFILDNLKTLQERRDYVVEALNRIDSISCASPKGAFYVFPNVENVCQNLNIFETYQALDKTLQNKTSPSTLLQQFALHQHHVATLDRRSFGKIGSADQHFLRLSYATDLSVLKEGLARLNTAFQDRLGFEKFIQEGKPLF